MHVSRAQSAAIVHSCIAWHGCMLNSQQLNARRAGTSAWMEISVSFFQHVYFTSCKVFSYGTSSNCAGRLLLFGLCFAIEEVLTCNRLNFCKLPNRHGPMLETRLLDFTFCVCLRTDM